MPDHNSSGKADCRSCTSVSHLYQQTNPEQNGRCFPELFIDYAAFEKSFPESGGRIVCYQQSE
jgi:hypothetical protein